MRADSSTPALVMALNSVLLPAFVYPTRATAGTGTAFAPLPLLRPNAAHAFDLLLQMQQPALNPAAVGFELRLARAACADAAAQLRHRCAPSRQPRQHVFQLRQLHLQLAFARACMTGKNIQDQLRAIHHPAGQRVFQVAQLGRGQVVIEENYISVGGSGNACQLLHLAAANQRRRIGLRSALDNLRRNLGPG